MTDAGPEFDAVNYDFRHSYMVLCLFKFRLKVTIFKCKLIIRKFLHLLN